MLYSSGVTGNLMVGVINGIYTPEEALQFLDDQTEAQGIINK